MDKKRYSSKFYLKLHKKLRRVSVGFGGGLRYLGLGLTYREWVDLLSFLKTTKKRIGLPRYKMQYNAYDFSRNVYGYIDSRGSFDFYKMQLRQSQIPQEQILNKLFKEKGIKWPQYWKKAIVQETRRIKDLRDDAKKNIVARCVHLTHKQFTVILNRKQFIRFREYCLEPGNLSVV